MRGAHAVCLVFDASKEIEKHDILQWASKIREAVDAQIILVGNKIELGRGFEVKEILKLATDLDVCYIEVSAKTGKNIN